MTKKMSKNNFRGCQDSGDGARISRARARATSDTSDGRLHQLSDREREEAREQRDGHQRAKGWTSMDFRFLSPLDIPVPI
jgi:hypothetical protein